MRLCFALVFLCFGLPFAPAFGQAPPQAEKSHETGLDENSDVKIYWQEKHYTVAYGSQTNFCLLAASNQYGSWSLVFFPKENSYYFTFQNDDATSLENGQEVDLNVAFRKGENYDFDWGSRKFSVSRDSEIRFQSDFLSPKFAADFAKNDLLAVYRETSDDVVLVFLLDLSGSARAVSKLRECAFKQSGLNPNDPFLQ